MEKRATSVRLSVEAKRLLASVARRLGISKTAALELAIRLLAEQHGVQE